MKPFIMELEDGIAEPAAEDAEFFADTIEQQQEAEEEDGFASLKPADKRFHVLFYFMVFITAALAVQLVWQIAAYTK